VATNPESNACSFLDWDDASIGQLCKKAAKILGDKDETLAIQATVAAMLLMESIVCAGADQRSWKFEGVTIPELGGDFEIVVSRLPKNREVDVDSRFQPMVN